MSFSAKTWPGINSRLPVTRCHGWISGRWKKVM